MMEEKKAFIIDVSLTGMLLRFVVADVYGVI